MINPALLLCFQLWSVFEFTLASTPILTTLAVLSTYVMQDHGGELSAEKIFVSIAYFNIIRLPMVMFPWAVIETSKLYVSLKR